DVVRRPGSVAGLLRPHARDPLFPYTTLFRSSPDDFKGEVSGADIHVSPDGKFLYASNRKDANNLAIYSIGKDGSLTVKGHQSVLDRKGTRLNSSHVKISYAVVCLKTKMQHVS